MDLYRINHIDEVDYLGLEEMLYGNGICLIEWSEKAQDLPENHIKVNIKLNKDYSREIKIEGI